MKKAIVPLSVILLLIITVFIYINRFSIYYVAEDDTIVFENDTISSNLTNGATSESESVNTEYVKLSENIYSSNKKYYVGDSFKKSISLDYPIVADDNSTLYIQTELGKYIDSSFEKTDVMVNSIITDATLYNGVNNVQVDDLTYNFLELNTGIHINTVELNIVTIRKTYTIPTNSYIYFGRNYIRYYFRDDNTKGEKEFFYREIPVINDFDSISVGKDIYTYKEFLMLMGLLSIEPEGMIPVDAIDDGERVKGEDTLKKRGKRVETERYVDPGPAEIVYVDPEIRITNLTTGVYSASFDLVIKDPARRISKSPTITLYYTENGQLKEYMRKTYSSSGHYVITGLLPGTTFEVGVKYEYKNKRNVTNKDSGSFIYINDVHLKELGEPYHYIIKTKDVSGLNTLNFELSSPDPDVYSVFFNSVRITNDPSDEALKGIKNIVIHFVKPGDDSGFETGFSSVDFTRLLECTPVSYDSKDVLASNTNYNFWIEVIDVAGNRMEVSNNSTSFKTLRKPPIANLKIADNNKDLTRKKIHIDIVNEDEMPLTKFNEGSRYFKYELVTRNGNVETVVSSSSAVGYFDAYSFDVNFTDLMIEQRYYVNIYCNYPDKYGVVHTEKINKEFSFVTAKIDSLIVNFDIPVESKDIGSDYIEFNSYYTNITANEDDVLWRLMDEDVTVVLTNKNTGETIEKTFNKADFFIGGNPKRIRFEELDSVTPYTVDIIPSITTGGTKYDLNRTISNKDFTTLKKDAEVSITNLFKAAGYFDFDVCVVDVDGAIANNLDGSKTVEISIGRAGSVYFNKKLDVITNSSVCDGLVTRVTATGLDPTLDYEFSIKANNYSLTTTFNDYSKSLYINKFQFDGVSGLVNLDKMVDQIAYELENKPSASFAPGVPNVISNGEDISSNADNVNIFDITNVTRWKGNGKDNTYDLKQLVVDDNSVELNSYAGGWRSYSYYIPELAGKPFTISFVSSVERSGGTLNTSQQAFCINNGLTGNSCPTANKYTVDERQVYINSTGNLVAELTENGSERHSYTFNALSSSGYITFYVKDESGSNAYNTLVRLTDVKLEYGEEATDTPLKYGVGSVGAGNVDYTVKYVGFFDSGIEGEAYNPTSDGAGCLIIDGSGEKSDQSEDIYFGETEFNNWKAYYYYLRFFENGKEVAEFRKDVTAEKDEFVDLDSKLCTEGHFCPYSYLKAFTRSNLDKDASYEVRVTIIGSSDGSDPSGSSGSDEGSSSSDSDEDSASSGPNWIAHPELYRYYDIYSYTFTTEIEARSIETVEDFQNMHDYGNYVVVNDLDFTNQTKGFTGTFQGTIDFQGHKVVMATKQACDNSFLYLFSTIGGGARIKNLDLHVIFNHSVVGQCNSSASGRLENFHGLSASNYGQIINIMVTTVNDTTDADVYAVDEDLSLLNSHVEYNHTKGELSDASFKTSYSSFITETNYGLIDRFVVNVKDPLYLHAGSALIVAPHREGTVNQGTIRNGYIYGSNIIAPYFDSTSRRLGIIGTSSSKNAVIENIYSLISIEIYDNGVTYDCPDGDNCTRLNNTYTASLVEVSADESIIRNIISYGDVIGYSDDESQYSLIEDIYNHDASIVSIAGTNNIKNLYNISRLGNSYNNSVTKQVTKLYFKDSRFLNSILNTHEAFLIDKAWRTNSYPQLDWPDCMPPQFEKSLDSADTQNEKFELISVNSVTQDPSKYKTVYGDFKSYEAQVELQFYTPNNSYRITKIIVDGINKSGSTENDSNHVIYVSPPSTNLSTHLSSYTLYFKQPYKYKDSYVIKNIYYTDGSREYSCNTQEHEALDCSSGSLNIDLIISLYKSVESFDDIADGISEGTTNFILTKDINCADGDSCKVDGSLPYYETIDGKINGGNHIISNLNVNNCLVGTLNGTIENIRINKFNVTYNSSTNLNGVYGGLVCKMGSKAVVDGVSIKEANVTAGSSNADIYIGGIVAYSSGGFISNSSIDGFTISDYSKMSTSRAYIGGILGFGKNIIVNNDLVRNINLKVQRYSSDNGNVTYGPNSVVAIGGITGYLDFGNIEDVYSTGNIISEFDNTGGIAGYNGGYIKNCISKVAIVGYGYVGSIVGKISGNPPSDSVAKTLALGDVLSSNNSSSIARTSGTKIVMNGNYVWDKQSINSVYTSNTDGETLLSVSDMRNPVVFSNRIGLSNESWLLTQDYKCSVGYSIKTDSNGNNINSLCVRDSDERYGYFANGFRFNTITEDNGNVVTYGYIPMLLNTNTGEPLYNQGAYPGEEGYLVSDDSGIDGLFEENRKKLIDLEIRFVEMFSIIDSSLVINYYYSNGNQILDSSKNVEADYAIIEFDLKNPNSFQIKKYGDYENDIPITIPNVRISNFNALAAGEKTHILFRADPIYYYDSYQITDIWYHKVRDDTNPIDYTVPVKLNLTFYGKISSTDDWNNRVIMGTAQNYYITDDLDFGGCHVLDEENTDARAKVGLSYNNLLGNYDKYNRNIKIKNICIKNMRTNTGFIENISGSIVDIDFEDIYLSSSSTSNSSYFGLIKTLDGTLEGREHNSGGNITMVPIVFKNIKIESPKSSYLGIIANNKSSSIRNVELYNIYVSGRGIVGGFIGYSILGNVLNVKMSNVYASAREAYVGGFMGYSVDSGARYYDEYIDIDGIYVENTSTYAGGAFGRGVGRFVTVTGSDQTFDQLKVINDADAPSWLSSDKKMNKIKGVGYIGGVVGYTHGNSSYYNKAQFLDIEGSSYRVGGIAGWSRYIYYSTSYHNKVVGRGYVGGITGQIGWALQQNLVVANYIEATGTSAVDDAAGGVGGVLNWTSVLHNQVTGDNSPEYADSFEDKYTIVKANGGPAGGIVGRTVSTRAWIYQNASSAVVYSSSGGAGGIVGYVWNINETGTSTNMNQIYRNAVENSAIGSGASLAGGLIGRWDKDSIVEGRIYENTIAASIYCVDVSRCGFITGGSNSVGQHNGDYLADESYYVNETSIQYVDPSSVYSADSGMCPATSIIVGSNCYTCPDGTTFSSSNLKCSRTITTAKYYPFVYKNMRISNDSALYTYTRTGSSLDTITLVSAMTFTEPTTLTPDHQAILTRTGTNWINPLPLKSTSGEDAIHGSANSYKNMSVTGKDSANYFAYMMYAARAYNTENLTTYTLPDEYKVALTGGPRKDTGALSVIGRANAGYVASYSSGARALPLVNVYVADVNKINIEFSSYGNGSKFTLNNQEYSINKRTFTFYYDFKEDFEIFIYNDYTSKVVKISADEIANNSVTIGDSYYYIDDGNVVTNSNLESNGYIRNDSTEDVGEEPGNIEPEEDIIDSGLVTTSNGGSGTVSYKFVGTNKTTVIDNANNIYGDEILLDNKNIYNITTGVTTEDDFENLTLAEDTPLYEFTYAGQNIKTYSNYSIVDGVIVNKILIIKNNKLEIIDNDLSKSSNSYLIDNYNDKEYVVYLDEDGKIHSLKDQVVLPKGFKNIDIKNISTTVGANTNLMLVEYKDGSYIVFNYRNGKIITKNSDSSTMGLGEYIKQYFELTFDTNEYTEENESYLEAKELVNKLNKDSIDSVLGESISTSYDTTYSIAYSSANKSYYVYQVPQSDSSSGLTVTESLNETVDSKIDSNEILIKFYREKESTKINVVSAFLIVISIVGAIFAVLVILKKYTKKHRVLKGE